MSAVTPANSLETAVVDGQRLRCTFSFDGEVFSHSIEVIEDGVAKECLASTDSQGVVVWPASPPWQELHVHEQANGSPALMLVGRAGSSHWSMSVTVNRAGDGFLFDVACRLRAMPEFLGTTYLIGEKSKSVSITPTACGDGPLATLRQNEASIVIDATHTAQSPGTTRWAYVIARSS